MEPEELLKEILRARALKATWRQKIKRWWKNRCLRCGAKLVIGLIDKEIYDNPFSDEYDLRYSTRHFRSPICEWCIKTNFSKGHVKVFQEKSKMPSKEGLMAIGVILLVLFLGIHACQ